MEEIKQLENFEFYAEDNDDDGFFDGGKTWAVSAIVIVTNKVNQKSIGIKVTCDEFNPSLVDIDTSYDEGTWVPYGSTMAKYGEGTILEDIRVPEKFPCTREEWIWCCENESWDCIDDEDAIATLGIDAEMLEKIKAKAAEVASEYLPEALKDYIENNFDDFVDHAN